VSQPEASVPTRSKTPIVASNDAAATSPKPWSIAAGIRCVAISPFVDAPRFGLILFVVFYGLDWVATVPPTVALTAEIFGREKVGILFGWIFASHMAGAAVAAWGAGAARTWFGGYGWAFGTSGLLCLFAVGLVAQISRPAPKPVLAPA